MHTARASRLALWVVALSVAAAACDTRGSLPAVAESTVAPSTTTTNLPAQTITTPAPAPAGIVVPVVRRPVSGEVIYFLLTDRFENGNPDNDTGGHAPGDSDADVLRHGFLPTDTGFYHGGDLAGLETRLDYLQQLGITSLWLTPPFTNRAVQGNGTVAGSSSGYHGYWQVDYTAIDPHLGTNAEMRGFVDAAHRRGMRVYFDAVANHTADVITFAEDSVAYRPKEGWPFRDATGQPFDDRDYAGTAEFPNLDPSISFAYTPVYASESDATMKAPAWLNDPIHYHNRGNSTFSGESSLYGDFFGLDDLFTTHPAVVAGMTDLYRSAVGEFGVDGFRVDTVKHVNDEFWDVFVPSLNAAAAEAGDDDFFIFGEVFSSDPLLRSHYTTSGPFPSVLDFGFSDATVAYVAEGGSAGALADLFADDDWYTDADSNASSLVKFVGNHDQGRLGGFIRAANSGTEDSEQLRRAELAMDVMFTTRGIPLVYYGDEQGFVGDGGDQGARQDMFPSRVDSYNDDDLIGTDATTAVANFDPKHPLYLKIAQLAALRREHTTLETGAQLTRLAEEGVFAFSRIDRTDQVEYVVAVNNATDMRTVSFEVESPATTFVAITSDGGHPVVSDDHAQLEITVPALGSVVYRADQPIPPSTAAPSIAITNPAPDAEVGFERFRIEAELEHSQYVEVTFAVSVDGGDFEVLGTDDAPPYRVFWNRSHVPAGSRIEVMATVDDVSGHRAVAVSAFSLA